MIFSRPKKRKDLRIFSIFPTLGKKYTENTKQREKKIRSELEQRNGKNLIKLFLSRTRAFAAYHFNRLFSQPYSEKNEKLLTNNSDLSFSSSTAATDGATWFEFESRPRSSSSCRVSSSTLATAIDNSFSFSLNKARIDSRSEAASKRKSKNSN